jgi:alkylhydroperoxidase family enzyme
MATYLPPIEKPKGPLLRAVYFFGRRQFGKVATPITVFSARMPAAFLSFYGRVSRLDKKLRLPAETVFVIRERVASINTCLFCMDASRWYALKQSPDNAARFDALAEYRMSPLFSDAERAALDYATELTRDKAVSQDTFDRLTRYYSEREICDIVWLVASEHLYNMSNIGLNIGSDGFCQLQLDRGRKEMTSQAPDAPVAVEGRAARST